MALSATELKVFIDAVSHYFGQLTRDKAVIRSSYLADTELPHFDYTGLITLSGQFRGCVYFSASRRLLRELLIQMQEPDTCEQNLQSRRREIIVIYSEQQGMRCKAPAATQCEHC